jgi:putative membrane protein
VILAAAVPFLAVATIWLGLTDRRVRHTRLAWWTFPIWLYVSITGVIVYLMLYQIYPPSG